jgi:hypothetical protein
MNYDENWGVCAEDATQWNSGDRKYGEVDVKPDNC